VKLLFPGTRGDMVATTKRHRRHSTLRVQYRGRAVVVDCGSDWLGRLDELKPRGVVLTHAHPDHVGGRAAGIFCAVYGTKHTLEHMRGFPLAQRQIIDIREPFRVAGITFEAFGLEHSVRAPAVGFRIAAGRVSVFYAPDVVYIHERQPALRKLQLHIGEGVTVSQRHVRKRDARLIGHAPIRDQLTWTAKARVPRARFTHCGTELVTGDERTLGARIRNGSRERNVEAAIAHDGDALRSR